MAVGDVISILGVAGVTLVYQPALGVETMISQIDLNGSNRYQKTDGVTVSNGFILAEVQGNSTNMKIFVNNTNYMQVTPHAGVVSAICGIQIK